MFISNLLFHLFKRKRAVIWEVRGANSSSGSCLAWICQLLSCIPSTLSIKIQEFFPLSPGKAAGWWKSKLKVQQSFRSHHGAIPGSGVPLGRTVPWSGDMRVLCPFSVSCPPVSLAVPPSLPVPRVPRCPPCPSLSPVSLTVPLCPRRSRPGAAAAARRRSDTTPGRSPAGLGRSLSSQGRRKELPQQRSGDQKRIPQFPSVPRGGVPSPPGVIGTPWRSRSPRQHPALPRHSWIRGARSASIVLLGALLPLGLLASQSSTLVSSLLVL